MTATLRIRRPAVALVAAAVGASLALAVPADAAPAGSPPATARASAPVAALRVTTTTVLAGFSAPTQVTSAPDGRDRLFVVEQRGRVRAVAGSRTWTYLDLGSRVRNSGEQGMLGLAFSPRFGKDRRLYVTYTRGDGALVLGRLKARKAGSRTVSASTLRTVLVVPHPGETNHNGGSLAFGPDGYLYLGTGDGGGSGDPRRNAGSLRSLSGKILRVDVRHGCGKRRYCVPRTNPYRGKAGGRGEILHRGLRNPWRISFDPAGRLWIGDVGQNAYEEIDVLPRGARGLDLGWSCREGTHPYLTSRCRSGARYTAPLIELAHPGIASSRDLAAQSITGGYVYRGRAYASLAAGAYVFGDWVTGNLWAYRDGQLARVGSLRQVTSFGEDDRGELYAVTSGGNLVRLRFA